MTVRSFVDTNILVYADDRRDREKQKTARDLLHRGIEKGRLVLSTQVLQEYFVSATRKLSISPEVARRKVELYSTQPVVVVQPDLILQAVDLHRQHQISFWDSLIVCAAAVSRCRVLYTEDLQAGFAYRGLNIVNPFLQG